MKKLLLQTGTLVIGLGLAVSLTGCCSMVKSCLHQVLIMHQPQSQAVFKDSDVTFSVYALGGPPFTTSGLSYQWQFNGTLLDPSNPNSNWAPIPGQTSSSITIQKVQPNNVGFYRVLVSGSDTVTSDPASLQVMTVSGSPATGGGPITVQGTPIATSAGTGTCPGPYLGYVYYTNSTAWGWTPVNAGNQGVAVDPQRTATQVQAFGQWGDRPCGATGSVSFPIVSPQYQFYIYFPSGTSVPTGNYNITLTNFH